jgi:DNA helicase IV
MPSSPDLESRVPECPGEGVGPPSHPELTEEQAYIDAAYARLDAMRAAAARVAAGFSEVGAGGTHQARLERDVADSVTRRRLAALDIGQAPLVFGRIDRTHDFADPDRRFYIGRLAVNDEQQEPLVVDWRAPVAEPFYRATGVAPMGVVRRRHFLTRPGAGRELVGIDDEVFDRDAADAAGLSAVGEAALLAVLDRARTGRMGDIVATIQAEQDEAIRADLAGPLIVSGGPGTGKTAVALHRAAYLLYTYRKRLGSQGVLLVGPSPIFLRYIDQVLPSLGEDEVSLSTAAGLKPQYRVTGVDDPATAVVKGDARMARVIARALRDRERPLPRDAVFALDGVILRITRRDSRRLVERFSRRRGTHNEQRPHLARSLVDQLRAQYRRALGAAAPDDPDWDREVSNRIRRVPEVRAALERMWPVLSGAELVHDLFSFEALVRSAADGILGREDQSRLVRPRAPHVREVAWTEGDLALIDEADALLGPPEAARPRRRRNRRRVDDDAATRVVHDLGVGGFLTPAQLAERYTATTGPAADDATEPRTFGHVLVDEAQDLSPMQWRMLARRCPSGSMTLVGDFGQASRPGSASGWDEVQSLIPTHAPVRHVTLTVNYRTPSEIMAVAARVLAAAAPGIDAPDSVRATGLAPEFVAVDERSVLAEVHRRATDAVRRPGTKAVIAPLGRHAALVDALADLGAMAGTADALDAPIAILGPVEAKGLEFDEVIVVEPAELVQPDRRGLRLLYVTLTRATQRLQVVHAQPLPEALAPAVPSGPHRSRSSLDEVMSS